MSTESVGFIALANDQFAVFKIAEKAKSHSTRELITLPALNRGKLCNVFNIDILSRHRFLSYCAELFFGCE